uniref:Uncharacterized protein n=1 Tax=Opuntia streptacantha TaxID=393608 RepID=A0A7C9EA81_OPUST
MYVISHRSSFSLGTRICVSFIAAIIFFNNSGTTSCILEGPCTPKSAFMQVSILLNNPNQNVLNPGFSDMVFKYCKNTSVNNSMAIFKVPSMLLISLSALSLLE